MEIVAISNGEWAIMLSDPQQEEARVNQREGNSIVNRGVVEIIVCFHCSIRNFCAPKIFPWNSIYIPCACFTRKLS